MSDTKKSFPLVDSTEPNLEDVYFATLQGFAGVRAEPREATA